MKKITQKLTAVLLAASMIITFIPILGTQTAYAATFPDKVSVGYRDSAGIYHSVTLDSAKPGYINGNPEPQEMTAGMEYLDFNAYYDVANRTLVLNNYQGGSIDERTGTGDLTIVLFRNNTIESKGNNAIYVPSGVEIKSRNNGKLTIINEPEGMTSYGIRAEGNVTLSGSCVLDITSRTLTTDNNDDAFGIESSHGKILIKDSAEVKVNCSTVSENTHGRAWGIYAHTGDIEITTDKPIDITLNAAGAQSGAYGIQTAGGSTEVTIRNIPYITMDLTAYETYLRGLLPQRAVEALSDADYHVVSEQSGRHLLYRIEPKPYVPETIDIQLDTSKLLPLTTEMTGKSVNQLFFPGIQSPVGTAYPEGSSDGWYIRTGDITGFCDDDLDWHELENSEAPLIEGEPYFFRFEIALDNTNYKWNTDQQFTINGSDEIIIYDGTDTEGRKIYIVGLQAIVPTDMSSAEITLDETSYTYDGTAKTPAVKVRFDGMLKEGLDYTVSYANNIDAGTATVTVTGIGIFKGTCTAEFEIKKSSVTVPTGAVLTYTGGSQAGVAAGELYTVTGNTAADAGIYEATASLKDKANYTWSDGTTEDKKVSWSISKAANPLSFSAKTATVKYKKLKKKAQKLDVTKVFIIANDTGDSKTFRLVSAKKGKKSFKKYFKINAATGEVTVKKKLKKGTYKVTVEVGALGSNNYTPSAVQTVTFKVKVK